MKGIKCLHSTKQAINWGTKLTLTKTCDRLTNTRDIPRHPNEAKLSSTPHLVSQEMYLSQSWASD